MADEPIKVSHKTYWEFNSEKMYVIKSVNNEHNFHKFSTLLTTKQP